MKTQTVSLVVPSAVSVSYGAANMPVRKAAKTAAPVAAPKYAGTAKGLFLSEYELAVSRGITNPAKFARHQTHCKLAQIHREIHGGNMLDALVKTADRLKEIDV
ncbi:MAG TPA: hypothetical protein VEK08_18590 [Planctomycetota bacterium]|nr:hypothetical protein [Planctomycetota bacterium]